MCHVLKLVFPATANILQTRQTYRLSMRIVLSRNISGKLWSLCKIRRSLGRPYH